MNGLFSKLQMKLEDVTLEGRLFRERVYENGKACGFLPNETAREMVGMKILTYKQESNCTKPSVMGRTWC